MNLGALNAQGERFANIYFEMSVEKPIFPNRKGGRLHISYILDKKEKGIKLTKKKGALN
jgi:hypothetical protein